MSSDDSKGFSKFRSFVWPIHSFELKKFLPLFAMAFFVGFNYTLLRNMKDTVLVSFSGAEAIPFVKVWGIVPGAVIVTALYGLLSNKYKRSVFYFFITGFLIFFALFVFVLYPMGDALHFHRFGDFLLKVLPNGFGGLISVIRYWSFSLFYIISELWSTAVLSMLFWGVANEITSIKEAGRFYSLINTGLNLSSVAAGILVVFISKHHLLTLSFAKDVWHNSMIIQTCLVLGAGGVIILLYRQLSKNLKDAQLKISEVSIKQVKAKNKSEKFKIKDLLMSIAGSRYLLYLAIGVLSYNLVIHLFEVVWKHQIGQLYPNALDFNIYMAKVAWVTGAVSTVVALLVSGQLIRKCGWTFGSFITPGVLAITGFCFFASIFLAKRDLFLGAFFSGISPLACVACFGSLHNILSRSAKFTFFDMTKEMAFIPLPDSMKLKGKAAIDGVVSRVGKSGGSFIYQILLISFSSVAGSINIIAALIFLILGGWSISIFFLGKRFKALVEEKNKEEFLIPSVVDSSLFGLESDIKLSEQAVEGIHTEPAVSELANV
ncbi:MAG: Npt1/Npt2 family nucleotide transporter [Victivallaceae bacterium]